ncbi:MAG: anti-sigma factor family protein [Terriglobia bacterium]
MNCKEVVRELSNLLDGELTPNLLEELERHLHHCVDCRIVVDTTRKTIAIFQHSEPMPLPEGVRHRLQQALASKLGRKPSPSP